MFSNILSPTSSNTLGFAPFIKWWNSKLFVVVVCLLVLFLFLFFAAAHMTQRLIHIYGVIFFFFFANWCFFSPAGGVYIFIARRIQEDFSLIGYA